MLKIAQELKAYVYKDEGWMFVNKQLHEVYDSFEFVSITIALDPAKDKQFNAIINSICKPGRWIRSISVKDLTAPTGEDLGKLDTNIDWLYLLMKHFPSVKKFDFSTSTTKEEDQARNWDYFSTVFMNHDAWNLETLPSFVYASNRCSPTYFNCAYYMRNSLTQLLDGGDDRQKRCFSAW